MFKNPSHDIGCPVAGYKIKIRSDSGPHDGSDKLAEAVCKAGRASLCVAQGLARPLLHARCKGLPRWHVSVHMLSRPSPHLPPKLARSIAPHPTRRLAPCPVKLPLASHTMSLACWPSWLAGRTQATLMRLPAGRDGSQAMHRPHTCTCLLA